MDTKVFCVYNLARGVFLSSKVTVADGANQPLKILKVLVGGLAMDAESGLWLSPVYGMPAVPRLFPFDLLYLDQDLRVVDLAEFLPGLEFPPYHPEVASALVLPSKTLHSTQTARGDVLVIGLQEDVENQIGVFSTHASVTVAPIPARGAYVSRADQGRFEAAPRESISALSATTVRVGTAGAVALEVLPIESTPLVVGPVIQSTSLGSIAADHAEEAKVVSPTAESVAAAPAVEPAKFKASEEKIELNGATPSDATTETPSANVDGSQLSKTPVISITEVVLERPRIVEPQIIVGQHSGVEDLFSNWVDSPSLATTWKAASAAPISDQIKSAASPPALDKADIPVKKSLAAVVSAETVSVSESSVAPTHTIASGQVKDEPEIKPVAPAASVNQAPVSNPARAVLPQPTQATSFTVAQYGLWRVSIPTAVYPVAAVKDFREARSKSTAADAPSKEVAEAAADTTKVEALKAADTNPSATNELTPASQPLTPQFGAKRSAAAVLSHVPPEVKPNPLEPAVQVAKKSARMAVEAAPGGPTVADTLRGPLGGEEERAVAFPAAQVESAVAESGQPSHELLESRSAATTGVPAAEAVDDVQRKLGIGQAKSPEAGTGIMVRRSGAAPASNTVSAASAKMPENAAATGPLAKREAAPGRDVALTTGIGNSEQAGMSKTSIRRVETNGRTAPAARTLTERFKRWLNPAVPANRDRRRAHRRYVPGMVAHYYTGGAPKPHEVADISMTGFYLLTEDRWMPDTMIQMTLQKPCAKGDRKQSITVLSKIVRRGSDGVAAQFVMPESLDPHSHDVQPSLTTDRFALARFI